MPARLPSEMASIQVSRRRQAFGYFGRISVLLDGLRVGKLSSGKSLHVTTEAGHHEVIVRTRFSTSNVLQFDVSQGGHVALQCQINPRYTKLMFSGIGALPDQLSLLRSTMQNRGVVEGMLEIWEDTEASTP